mmetsp:Transcript_3230/g.12943  ORF Transcript_3230/g.12943 Transcript_3230/m.12943 type:complete len:422 (+) Transcript_3230:917-2182(+)
MANKIRHVAQRGVGTIQKAELHELVRRHLVGEEHAVHEVPRGAAVHEVVLDDPLEERLGHHGPAVLDAELFGDERPVVLLRGRRDPIHHGVWEGHLRLDPLHEVGLDLLEEVVHAALDGVSVHRKVVAAHHGDRGDAGSLPPDEHRGDEAEGGLRHGDAFVCSLPVGDLILDDVVAGIQAALDVPVVALLRHGERDDLDARVAEAFERGLGVLGHEDEIKNGPHHAGGTALLAAHQQGVQVVLLGQRVVHLLVPGHEAHADDAPLLAFVVLLLHELIQDVRLVRAVEATDADVCNVAIGHALLLRWQVRAEAHLGELLEVLRPERQRLVRRLLGKRVVDELEPVHAGAVPDMFQQVFLHFFELFLVHRVVLLRDSCLEIRHVARFACGASRAADAPVAVVVAELDGLLADLEKALVALELQ